MGSFFAASLINLIGFVVGSVLYSMLGFMVLQSGERRKNTNVWGLLLLTAFLGFLWNFGELILVAQRDLGDQKGNPFLIAASYSALGFLPTVVVNSALYNVRKRRWIVIGAYWLSCVAAFLHFYSVAVGSGAPSELSLQVLTIGSIVLAFLTIALSYKETKGQRFILAAALMIFAASALHLSRPGDEGSVLVELIAHQSSLPLALVILLQNYRFAFADLFLKRALSLILLSLTAFAGYTLIARPILLLHEGHDASDAQATGVILALWIATALLYKRLESIANWMVDRLMLQRPDYEQLRDQITKEIETFDDAESILDSVAKRLASTFTAKESGWKEVSDSTSTREMTIVGSERDRAEVLIPTNDLPSFLIYLRKFDGGRRLLSQEAELLNTIAMITARRIDALRIVAERFEQEFREQELSRLVAESRLMALRAQIDPHFLFNALTTIGYLIQTSPSRAMETLLRLTGVLRRVLSHSDDFTTLGQELEIVRDYLAIEQARFEERLNVEFDVPNEMQRIILPTLILQPLVENAIKHAISENPKGGWVRIKATAELNGNGSWITLSVEDSGAGKKINGSAGLGVGLENIRARLAALFSDRAVLKVEIDGIRGSRSSVTVPIEVEAET